MAWGLRLVVHSLSIQSSWQIPVFEGAAESDYLSLVEVLSRGNVNDRFNNTNFSLSSISVEVEAGAILVASPAMRGTEFEKAVVLVLQSSFGGTFGVVLNRPANDKMRFAFQELMGSPAKDRHIVNGGPIGGPIIALHQDPDLGEMELVEHVFITSTSDSLKQLALRDSSRYLIVFGLTGWKRGQLSREIDNGTWFRLAGHADAVFDDPAWIWEKSLRRYGQQLLCDVVGLDRIPENPLLN